MNHCASTIYRYLPSVLGEGLVEGVEKFVIISQGIYFVFAYFDVDKTEMMRENFDHLSQFASSRDE